jgi:hypothetical protein
LRLFEPAIRGEKMTFRPRQNRILAALEKGEIPLGMQMYTGDPSLIEILAYTGFDFYMLDMEHSRVNVETMDHCIRAADAAGKGTTVGDVIKGVGPFLIMETFVMVILILFPGIALYLPSKMYG